MPWPPHTQGSSCRYNLYNANANIHLHADANTNTNPADLLRLPNRPSPCIYTSVIPDLHHPPLHHLGGLLAIILAHNKVIARSTSMRNHTGKLAGAVENDTVRAGAAAAVHIVVLEHGELVPGAGGGKVEALVVVVLVRVLVCAQRLARALQRASLLLRRRDIGRRVRVGAAHGAVGLPGVQDRSLRARSVVEMGRGQSHQGLRRSWSARVRSCGWLCRLCGGASGLRRPRGRDRRGSGEIISTC